MEYVFTVKEKIQRLNCSEKKKKEVERCKNELMERGIISPFSEISYYFENNYTKLVIEV